MGLLSSIKQLMRKRTKGVQLPPRTEPEPWRRCRFETMEERRLLDADPLQFGAVYIEQDIGSDLHGDTFEITFRGGAADTQLNRVVINTDKQAPGYSTGDLFFDTAESGLGVDHAFGFQIVSLVASQPGADVRATAADGGMELVLDFTGFHAGDKLVFSIDVDEVQDYNPLETDPELINEGFDPLASGAEFQGARVTAQFSAPHYHDVAGSGEFRNRYDALLAGRELDLSADDAGGRRDRSAGTGFAAQQQPLPISIAGTVYLESDLDLTQDVGEPGIADVELSLWKRQGDDYVATGHTTRTDAQGHYSFGVDLKLQPGMYQVREAQPIGLFSVGALPGAVAGTPSGSSPHGDLLTDINIPLGDQHGVDYDFAEARPAAISGYVYHDRSNDGDRAPGEEGLAGVTVQVIPVNTIATQSVVAATTNADGFYEATGLAPGTYRVVEAAQPAAFFDGLDRAGTVLGATVGRAVNPGDAITDIFLGGGQRGDEYNFGEIAPAAISGRVHLADENGLCGEGDGAATPITGVTVTLYDAQGAVVATQTTNEQGEYAFRNLHPGSYRVVEATPIGLLDSGEHPGTINGQTVGSVVANDAIAGIVLSSGDQAIHYNFCEVAPASISGYVYHDRANNGRRDPADEGIGGVEIQVVPVNTALPQATVSTRTSADGSYQVNWLSPGTYRVVEVQPAGYVDGLDTAGSTRGTTNGAAANPGDAISQIVLKSGDAGVQYNFGEFQLAAISGNVHAGDPDADCFDPAGNHTPLAGVTIQLLNDSGELVRETQTDETGNYRFDGLLPGAYTVVETTPAGYLDGGERAGTVAGQTRGAVGGSDRLTGIALTSGEQSVNNDFCEEAPASLAGNVYHDRNNDGLIDPGEEPIPGVTIVLQNATGVVVATTTTDEAGAYQFTMLAAGVYRVAETQPANWSDGLDSVGLVGTQTVGAADNDAIRAIQLRSGDQGVEYNFGELLDARLSGIVHVDRDSDCTWDEGELLLANVPLELLDATGQVVAATTTNATGEYSFTGLRPGVYQVRQTQPAGYFTGGEVAGSHGGATATNLIAEIAVSSGDVLVGYNFCELPPAKLSGYVFQDGTTLVTADGKPPTNLAAVRDGRHTPDDTPIAGVVMELRDGVTGQPIDAAATLGRSGQAGIVRAETNADGYYEFTGLLGGRSYAVFQVHPSGYADGIDTPGTTSGHAFNVGGVIRQDLLLQLTVPPLNDAIVGIFLGVGGESQLNNFSEVVVEAEPPPPSNPIIPISPPPGRPGIPAPQAPPLIIAPPNPAGGSPILPSVIAGGIESGVGYTWHLSIINGGSPRDMSSSLVSTDAVWKHARFLDREGWSAHRLQGASWTLLVTPAGDSTSAEVQRQHNFGVAGGIPVAGDFNGDGTDEIAVFDRGEWFIDLNHNGVWDEEDLWARLGGDEDLPVVGDWDGDGKDDIGIFGPEWRGDRRAIAREPGIPDLSNRVAHHPKNPPPKQDDATDGERLLQQHAHGHRRADVIDHVFRFGAQNGIPVAGDWNGDGIRTVGIFRDGVWQLDLDGDGRWTQADAMFHLGQSGDIPVVGDFDGDSVDEIGVYRAGQWILDVNGNREQDAHDRVFELGGAADYPVVGDWAGDGIDRPGLYHAQPTPVE